MEMLWVLGESDLIPFFNSIKGSGEVPITDKSMTRFMITLEEGVQLVWHALKDMVGGEIYVKRIPPMKVTDLAEVVAPNDKQVEVGIRPGEKIHEQMIGEEDAMFTYKYKGYYKILPSINDWGVDTSRIKDGEKVPDGFTYNSQDNSEWMTKEELESWLKDNINNIGIK